MTCQKKIKLADYQKNLAAYRNFCFEISIKVSCLKYEILTFNKTKSIPKYFV